MIDRKHLIVGTGHGARFVLKLLKFLPDAHEVVIATRRPDINNNISSLHPACNITDLSEVHGRFNSVWLAVPDSFISFYASSLRVEAERWIHLSGASEMALLSPHDQCGVVVWPVISLASSYDVKEVPIVIESQKDDSFVHLLTETFPNCLKLGFKERLMTHVAAAIANNLVQFIYEVLDEELKINGIKRDLIKPIIDQTFRRIQEGNLAGSLSGPARRGDFKTIEKHLNAIHSEHLKDIYKVITYCIQASYEKKL